MVFVCTAFAVPPLPRLHAGAGFCVLDTVSCVSNTRAAGVAKRLNWRLGKSIGGP